MRLWKSAAILVSILGLSATILVVLANLAGVRVGGFDGFYSPRAEELMGITLLFLLGAVAYLIDRISAISTSLATRSEATPSESEESSMAPSESEPDLSRPVVARSDSEGSTTSRGLIRVSRISKVYHLGPVKVHALREVTLDIPPGSLTVVLGPSGSGKTTFLNLLGGIDRATSGTIWVGRTDVTALDDSRLVDYRRERVGFVFQFFNLIPSLTARENVALAAELVPDAMDVDQVLRKVGLGSRLDHFPSELSGGEQQRVAIARALVKNPPLLLCDEPTGELDYATGIKVLEILKDVAHRDGRAVIVVTHNATIADMADLVVRLRGGSLDQVVRNPEPVPPQMLRW